MKRLIKTLLILMLTWGFVGIAYADTSYFRELVNKGNATYYDAYRIITILHSGQDNPQLKFEDMKKQLWEQGISPDKWDVRKADELLNRGAMAYMLFKTLKLKGGLTVRCFGLSGRYAFRECVNKKLMARGFPNQLLSGEELISILAEAGKYQEKHPEILVTSKGQSTKDKQIEPAANKEPLKETKENNDKEKSSEPTDDPSKDKEGGN